MKHANQLKDLSSDVQTKVLKIHHEIFGNSACKTCTGDCCRFCGPHKGYLTLSKENFRELTSRFDFTEEEGFRGPTGCNLPLRERSPLCLSYFCSGLSLADKIKKGKGYLGPLLEGRGPKVSKPFSDNDERLAYEMKNLFWED